MLGNAILTPTMEECGKIKKFFYHRSDKTIGELERSWEIFLPLKLPASGKTAETVEKSAARESTNLMEWKNIWNMWDSHGRMP